MMYSFMTLDDGTEIIHSEMKSDNTVKVYIESRMKPIAFTVQSAFCRITGGKIFQAFQSRR